MAKRKPSPARKTARKSAGRTALNISLTPALNRFIEKQVASGRYQTASEVVRQGLRHLEQELAEREQLRRDIQQGLDELERGEGIPAEQVFAELRRLSRERRRKRA